MIWGDVIREVGGVVRELIPDADKRLDIQVRLAELADKADQREAELLSGQIEVNKVEAASGNLFVAGWRPFIGWTCGVALGYSWVLAPLGKAMFGLSELPAVPTEAIYPILLALLGIGGLRTFEKVKGVAGGTLGKDPRSVESTIPVVKSSRRSILPSWLQ